MFSAVALSAAMLSVGGPLMAAVDDTHPSPLVRLSVEDLAQLKVVTVSRRSERAMEAGGAVSVITAEDIQRTGATRLADALRLSPGVQASQIDADEWALAIRGFASRLSRSILVMMDGRSLWTPLFAGVFWGTQDTLIEDVDRIEVSRGPGGALYGANALNGVIHVITKNARDTQGGLVSLLAGSAQQSAGARFGAHSGEKLYYRAYAKYFDRDGTYSASAAGYDDEWRMGQGGFRLDWTPDANDVVGVHGDLYGGSAGTQVAVTSFTAPFTTVLTGDSHLRGRNLVTRWQRGLADGTELTTQLYYDATRRQEPHYSEQRDTMDLDLQYRFRRGRHDAVGGVSYRLSHGAFQGLPTLQINPANRTDDIAGVFANDEFRAFRERLRVTVGSKLEWNDYSGWNVQPSARLAWVLNRNTLWGAATRGVRTASRVEHDILTYTALSATAPVFARTQGSSDFTPESVVALEGGWKGRPLPKLLCAATVFFNRYDDLASNEVGAQFVEAGGPGEPARVVIPVRIANGQQGTTTGVETSAVAYPVRAWRVRATYSFLKLNQTTLPDSTDVNRGFEGNSPRHQFWLSSYWALPHGFDLDGVFRRVSAITTHKVAAFSELDLRLGYSPRPRWQLAVVGQNLLHARHAEFGGGFEIERAVYAQATLGF